MGNLIIHLRGFYRFGFEWPKCNSWVTIILSNMPSTSDYDPVRNQMNKLDFVYKLCYTMDTLSKTNPGGDLKLTGVSETVETKYLQFSVFNQNGVFVENLNLYPLCLGHENDEPL